MARYHERKSDRVRVAVPCLPVCQVQRNSKLHLYCTCIEELFLLALISQSPLIIIYQPQPLGLYAQHGIVCVYYTNSLIHTVPHFDGGIGAGAGVLVLSTRRRFGGDGQQASHIARGNIYSSIARYLF